MEQINYNELLDHKIFLYRHSVSLFIGLLFFGGMMEQHTLLGKLLMLPLIGWIPIYVSYKMYAEEKENKKKLSFYNKCVEKYESVLVDENTHKLYDKMSKDLLHDRIQLMWEPIFDYDNETKVYNLLNTNLYTVVGYFKDIYDGRENKIKYTIVFINGKYYFNCIDNIILCDKDSKSAGVYTRKKIKMINSFK